MLLSMLQEKQSLLQRMLQEQQELRNFFKGKVKDLEESLKKVTELQSPSSTTQTKKQEQFVPWNLTV